MVRQWALHGLFCPSPGPFSTAGVKNEGDVIHFGGLGEAFMDRDAVIGKLASP